MNALYVQCAPLSVPTEPSSLICIMTTRANQRPAILKNMDEAGLLQATLV